jgi:hypothetical protein
MDILGPLVLGFVVGFYGLKTGTKIVDGMSTAVKGLGKAFKTSMKGTIVGLIVMVIFLLIDLYQHNETFRHAVQATWAWIKDHWPLLRAILSVLFFPIVWIITHMNQIKAAAIGVFNWIKNHWVLLLSILTGPFGAAVIQIIQHWDQIKEFFSNLPGKFKEWGKNMGKALVTGIVDAIKASPTVILDAIKSIVPSGLQSAIGTVVGGIGDLVGGATGGTITRGGAILVGERGPEIVHLPMSARIVPNEAISSSVGDWGGGGGLTIHVPVVVDGRQIAEVNHKASLKRAARR